MGSVRHLVNPAGTPLLSQSYDPFGNILQQGGTEQSIFGYTGEQTDPTQLVYLRARYYDPTVGRFLTADSLVPDPFSSQGWNGYAYTYNNPIRYTDPSGHEVPLKCFICELEIDVSDWPHLGKFAAFVASAFTDLNYDFEQEKLLGPTKEEWLESAWTNCLTPIGMAKFPFLGKGGSKGWKVGDPIDQLDELGNYPIWETARDRYWKNRAASSSGEFSPQNIGRMKQGLAPKVRIIARMRDSGEEVELLVSKDLHHISGRGGATPHNAGNIVELWPWEHEAMDTSRHVDYDFVRFR